MQCEKCGNGVTTPYCPNCGTSTGLNVGASLLRHCQQQIKSHKKGLTGGNTDSAWYIKKQTQIIKWENWARFVESACALADRLTETG